MLCSSVDRPESREFKNCYEIKLDITINPDEAVAYGAALHAAILRRDFSDKIFGKLIQDLTPLSLGYDVFDSRTNKIYTSIVIPRNTPIPTSKLSCPVTVMDNQKSCAFTIRQGESQVPEHNFLLGKFEIRDLPEGPAGSVKFNAKFDIDANGILTVTATETSTGKTNSIKIENISDHSRKEQLKKMIENARKDRVEQENRKIAVRAKVAFRKNAM